VKLEPQDFSEAIFPPIVPKRKSLDTSEFEFLLPEDLIAQQPVEPRDQSRLMVISRQTGKIEHRRFAELPGLLDPGDTLVRNNTRVVPARLLGHRASTGGKWEGLFLRTNLDRTWEILAKTRGRPQAGERIHVEGGLSLLLVEQGEAGRWTVLPESDMDVETLLLRHGHVPLPPYIRKGSEEPNDRLRYQTVFATQAGAVAAPTAGLHFTPDLLNRLAEGNIRSVEVTLHVGLGTFRPIEVASIEDHVLHSEWAELTEASAEILNERRSLGGRVIAIGTTSTRTLETSVSGRRYQPFQGETALYLKPGHTFPGVDALITNFHLPRSSLLVLVSAFAGMELTREAYSEAIRERYRFYSYGDAMLIL